jgi:hypothetical protein
MTIPKLSAPQLRGIALTIFISAAFGAAWGLSGSTALVGGWRWVCAAAAVAVTLAYIIAAYRFHRRASQLPAGAGDLGPNPFGTWPYRLAVIGEIIAIPLAGRLLSASGHGDAIMPAVAIIVGLHFFGLIPAFRSWHFAWVGGAFCAIAAAALAMPARISVGDSAEQLALRSAIVGLGCALVLWASILPITLAARRQLAAR